MLPDSDERGAHIAAERMRHAIREGFAEDPVPLTISFGIACFPAARGDHRGPDGERRPGALHGEGDRPRLLRDLRTGCGRRGVGARAPAPRAGRGPPDEPRHAGRVTRQPRALRRRSRRYAREIARELGYPEDRLERLVLAGVLHDVGKVGIPNSIVMKPGPLTAEEWAVMRKHPEIGASMLEGVSAGRARRLGPRPPRASRRDRIPARPRG